MSDISHLNNRTLLCICHKHTHKRNADIECTDVTSRRKRKYICLKILGIKSSFMSEFKELRSASVLVYNVCDLHQHLATKCIESKENDLKTKWKRRSK